MTYYWEQEIKPFLSCKILVTHHQEVNASCFLVDWLVGFIFTSATKHHHLWTPCDKTGLKKRKTNRKNHKENLQEFCPSGRLNRAAENKHKKKVVLFWVLEIPLITDTEVKLYVYQTISTLGNIEIIIPLRNGALSPVMENIRKVLGKVLSILDLESMKFKRDQVWKGNLWSSYKRPQFYKQS